MARKKRTSHVGFASAVILSVALTCVLCVFCFVLGDKGLLKHLQALPVTGGDEEKTKTAEEQIAEKESQMAGLAALLESPYMVVVDRDTAAPEEDTASFDDVEGVKMDAQAARQLALFLAAARENGCEVVVLRGYVSARDQQKRFDKAVDALVKAGHTEQEATALTLKTTSQSGYSEHQTGYAVDLAPFADATASETLASAFYAFAAEHAAEYGFVQSYTASSSVLTGRDEDPTHFRYVGNNAGASYISARKTTLKAYRSYLQNRIETLAAEIEDLKR